MKGKYGRLSDGITEFRDQSSRKMKNILKTCKLPESEEIDGEAVCFLYRKQEEKMTATQ